MAWVSLQCLVEAILILDVLCRQDPSFLYRTLSCLKALHTRLGTDPGSERAVLPLAQFFLNHGEAAAVGSEAIYQHLLTRLPSEHFHNPMLAFEVIRFCRDNLPLFDLHLLGILKSSFPNLFKACAVVLRGHGPGCQGPGPIPSMQSWAPRCGVQGEV